MLCGVRSPLHCHPGSRNTGNDTVHQLEFWDLEVVDGFVSLPHTSTGIQDRLLVGMKELEGGGYLSELVIIELSGLSKIPEIHEGSESDDKGWWCLPSDDADEVPLDLAMRSASDLLETRHTILEILETSDWLNGCKPEVEFVSCNDADRPFDVVIPELFMPVV